MIASLPLPARRVALLLISATLAACSSDGVTDPPALPPTTISAIEIAPATDTLLALGDTLRLSARAWDAAGAPVTAGPVITWQSSDPDVVAVSATGIATALANGAATITASVGDARGAATLAVEQRVAAVAVTPTVAALTTAGGTQRFEAVATDANGNVVEGAPVLWQSSNHGVALVDADGVAEAVASGVATIIAFAGGVPGAASLTVDQRLARLAFLDAPPAAVTAGAALDPALRVELLDADGYRVRDAEVPVTIHVGADPGGAVLGGSRTVTSVAGVAVFSGLWLDRAASGYTLSAASADLDPVESAPFDVLPGAAHQVAFAFEPTGDTASTHLDPIEVVVHDRFGNLVPSADDEVRVSLAESTAAVALAGTTVVAAEGGVARFTQLELQRAGVHRLAASATGLTGARSQPFTIHPAHPVHLSVLAGPEKGEGQERLPPLQVAVVDRFGNIASLSGSTISVALAGGHPEATLSGTLSRTTESGVATFADLRVDRPGDGYVLRAAGAFTPQETAPFEIGLTFADVTAGTAHSCGLTVTGRAYCWGYNEEGALGDGTTTERLVPSPVLGGHRFTTLVAGRMHTCGVTDRSEAFCWGRNTDGQLGNGTAAASSVPVPVSGVQDYVGIAAGLYHTCASTKGTTVRCWGGNAVGELGDGTTTPSAVPVEVASGATLTRLVAGEQHTCGLDVTGILWCWGWNFNAQLGDGTTVDRLKPQPVAGTQMFTSASAGKWHTCATTPTGATYCWGANHGGQLGDGTTTGRLEPRRVVIELSDLALAAGDFHTCGLAPSGHAYCWGANAFGEVGDGTTVTRTTATLVSGGLTFVRLAGGAGHTCGVTAAGAAYCWGANYEGALGNGTKGGSLAPTAVSR